MAAKKIGGRRKAETATIRVVVKMTPEEERRLKKHCDDEVRTVGSWFRLKVHEAWRAKRKNAARAKTYQRNSDDGLHRGKDVWARLTETERDWLDILCDIEGVSVSLWFRKRLPS